MGPASILLLAVALAMDSMAASATRGLAAERVGTPEVIRVALVFGGFQALMPVLGWGLGESVGPLVIAWDHWIAFVLLAGIGGRTLWEGLFPDGEAARDPAPLRMRTLVLLGIATSIDALAAGITLPLLDAPFVLSIVTIGLTTALLSAVGLHAGRHCGARLGRGLDVFGGLVLIGLGTRILCEHLGSGPA